MAKFIMFNPSKIKYPKTRPTPEVQEAPITPSMIHLQSPSARVPPTEPPPYPELSPLVNTGLHNGLNLPPTYDNPAVRKPAQDFDKDPHALHHAQPSVEQTGGLSGPADIDDGRRNDHDNDTVAKDTDYPALAIETRHASTDSQPADDIQELVGMARSVGNIDAERDDCCDNGLNFCDGPAFDGGLDAGDEIERSPEKHSTQDHLSLSPCPGLSERNPVIHDRCQDDNLDDTAAMHDTDAQMPGSDPAHDLQDHGTRGSSQGIKSSTTIQGPGLSDHLGQTVSIPGGRDEPRDGPTESMDCNNEAIDISQVGPDSRSADRAVTRVVPGGTGKTHKRPAGSSEGHASRPIRRIKIAGEFQTNTPHQELDEVCGAQDITTILSTLHGYSNRERGQLTLEIYYTFLQQVPNKGSRLYGLMAHLSQCQRVEIFLQLLTSLGDCDELSDESSTIPRWFSTSLRKGRSAEETLVGKLLELHCPDSGGRSRPT